MGSTKKAMQNQDEVDYFALANKLQNALAASYVEVQEFERVSEILDKHITLQNYHLSIKQKRVEDLEFLLAGSLRDGKSRLDGCDEDSAV